MGEAGAGRVQHRRVSVQVRITVSCASKLRSCVNNNFTSTQITQFESVWPISQALNGSVWMFVLRRYDETGGRHIWEWNRYAMRYSASFHREQTTDGSSPPA